jgi:hypothetical protein
MALRSERRFISLDDVLSGMIIEFNYTKLDGTANSYIVLVVDPNRQNERAKEPQLHGFLIEDMSDEELFKFASEFGTSITIDPISRKNPFVSDLNTDEAYKRFVGSTYSKDRTYRTFLISKMSKVRQVLIGAPEE